MQIIDKYLDLLFSLVAAAALKAAIIILRCFIDLFRKFVELMKPVGDSIEKIKEILGIDNEKYSL